jgi:hypothetical protein
MLIPIFVLYIIYLIMKKSKTTPEKPAPKAKAEQPVATVVTKAPPKNPSPAKKTPKKAEVVAPKPVEATPEIAMTDVKSEQSVTAVITKAIPKKPSPDPKIAKKAPVGTTKPVMAVPEMTIPEQVGLAAGSIWHYLAENGATSVSKLVKELSEEEKIIQRSIGWLAQEGKITLDVINRVETIALKE